MGHYIGKRAAAILIGVSLLFSLIVAFEEQTDATAVLDVFSDDDVTFKVSENLQPSRVLRSDIAGYANVTEETNTMNFLVNLSSCP